MHAEGLGHLQDGEGSGQRPALANGGPGAEPQSNEPGSHGAAAAVKGAEAPEPAAKRRKAAALAKASGPSNAEEAEQIRKRLGISSGAKPSSPPVQAAFSFNFAVAGGQADDEQPPGDAAEPRSHAAQQPGDPESQEVGVPQPP